MDHHLGPAVHILVFGIAGSRHQCGQNPHPQKHVPDRLGTLVGERPPLGLRACTIGMTDHRDRRLAVLPPQFEVPVIGFSLLFRAILSDNLVCSSVLRPLRRSEA